MIKKIPKKHRRNGGRALPKSCGLGCILPKEHIETMLLYEARHDYSPFAGGGSHRHRFEAPLSLGQRKRRHDGCHEQGHRLGNDALPNLC